MLAQHAQRVIAVDPAALDERALLPGVTHLACKAEDVVEQIHAMVGQAGVDLLVSGGPPLRLLQLAVVAVAAVVAALGMSAGIELVSAAPCCCWGS